MQPRAQTKPNFSIAIGLSIITLFTLAACQDKTTGGPSSDLALSTSKAPTATVVAIAKTAQTCWFKSGDPAFKKYRLAAEVNSYAGRPRFLIVPKNNPGGLPVLVVQAEKASGKTKVQTFGPILSSDQGSRINEDVRRWASGESSCAQKA